MIALKFPLSRKLKVTLSINNELTSDQAVTLGLLNMLFNQGKNNRAYVGPRGLMPRNAKAKNKIQ